jgi:hypothetical protein
MSLGKTEPPTKQATPPTFDPDPFTIGLAIFTALAGGGAFLEAQRQRQFVERQHGERFRTVWFSAKRALIFFGRAIDEFETYMLEDDYGAQSFRIGAVRLTVDAGRHHALRTLKGQAITTANVISDTLDDLSEFLGPDYQQSVQVVLDKLSKLTIPERYSEVIRAARKARDLYDRLLNEVGDREGFERVLDGSRGAR